MKIFAIKNESDFDRTSAYLFYYEKAKEFYIELVDGSNEWNTPMILSSFAKRNKKIINPHWSKIWVEQRVIPSDRQNLAQILKDNKLKNYDIFGLLTLSEGRCAQDDYYISPLKEDKLPKDIKNRRTKRIDDVFPIGENKVLTIFFDGKIKVCNLSKLIDESSPLGIYINRHPESIYNFKIQTGGNGIYWDENMSITYDDLYTTGKDTGLKKEDLITYILNRIVNTSEVTNLLNCTRQNIDDLINRNKLIPIKEMGNGKLFLKSDIEKRDWI